MPFSGISVPSLETSPAARHYVWSIHYWSARHWSLAACLVSTCHWMLCSASISTFLYSDASSFPCAIMEMLHMPSYFFKNSETIFVVPVNVQSACQPRPQLVLHDTFAWIMPLIQLCKVFLFDYMRCSLCITLVFRLSTNSRCRIKECDFYYHTALKALLEPLGTTDENCGVMVPFTQVN